MESRCERTGSPPGPVTTSPAALVSLSSTTRPVRGQDDVLNTSTAAASRPSPRDAEHGATAASCDCAVGVQGERLLDLPLVLDERRVGLGDAVVGAPGVLVVEDHVAPGLGEWPGGVLPRAEHGGERLGLHEPLGGRAVQGRFAGRRAGPVLPVGREIAADDGNLVGVALLELAEHLGRRGDHQLRLGVLVVPALTTSESVASGGPLSPPTFQRNCTMS